MIGYKGFDKDLKCGGKQYKVGETYKEDVISLQFCENPFAVIDDYDAYDRFCSVESLGRISSRDKRLATNELKITAEIGFCELFEAGIGWLFKVTSGKKESGGYTQIGSSGGSAKIGSSGNYAQIGSSGDYAKIGSSGNYAQIGSSGDSAQIGSSGDYAKIGSSGNYAQIGSSGDSAQIGSSGGYAVVMCAGDGSIAKAKKGSWITLSEWEYDRVKRKCVPICVKTEQVDGVAIKEDTFYKLVNKKFTEV